LGLLDGSDISLVKVTRQVRVSEVVHERLVELAGQDHRWPYEPGRIERCNPCRVGLFELAKPRQSESEDEMAAGES
jgi:hypothetical protein